MTPDVRKRFSRANDLPTPDLWTTIQERLAQRRPAPVATDGVSNAGPRQRLVAAVVAFAVFGAAALFAVRAFDHVSDPVSAGDRRGVWHPLPEGPLSARSGANGFWAGGRVVIVGGRDTEPCPPGADCALPEEPPLRDGAAYTPATDTWTTIAPAPVPIGYVSGAVVGDRLYLWDPGLDQQPTGRSSFVSYDPGRDAWEELPLPPGAGPTSFLQLVATDTGVVAYPTSHEHGVSPDFLFDPSTSRWRELPPDPLVPSFDRTMVWTGSELVLLGIENVPQPGSDGPALYRAASFDLSSGEWRRLPDSEVIGYDPVWFWSGGRVVNPTLGTSDGGKVNGYGRSYPHGGMLDPTTGEWTDLPPRPKELGSYAGPNVGSDRYVVSSDGAILDPSVGTWGSMPGPPDGAAGETVVWADDRLVSWGASEWDGSEWIQQNPGWWWQPGGGP